jgi:hypothetical protein
LAAGVGASAFRAQSGPELPVSSGIASAPLNRRLNDAVTRTFAERTIHADVDV